MGVVCGMFVLEVVKLRLKFCTSVDWSHSFGFEIAMTVTIFHIYKKESELFYKFILHSQVQIEFLGNK